MPVEAQKRVLDPLEVESQLTMMSLAWLLGIKYLSFGRIDFFSLEV